MSDFWDEDNWPDVDALGELKRIVNQVQGASAVLSDGMILIGSTFRAMAQRMIDGVRNPEARQEIAQEILDHTDIPENMINRHYHTRYAGNHMRYEELCYEFHDREYDQTTKKQHGPKHNQFARHGRGGKGR